MLNPPRPVPDQITEALRQAKSILIVSHVFPDADAIGSQLALGNILESQGKKIFYYCDEFVSGMYEFMPGSEQLDSNLPDIRRGSVPVCQGLASLMLLCARRSARESY